MFVGPRQNGTTLRLTPSLNGAGSGRVALRASLELFDQICRPASLGEAGEGQDAARAVSRWSAPAGSFAGQGVKDAVDLVVHRTDVSG